MNRWIKPTKGIAYFLAFFVISLALVLQPERGVPNLYHNDISVSIIMGTLFGVSSLANLFIGLTRLRFNLIWFAVYYSYTIMSIMLLPDVPVTTVTSNILLCGLMTIDVIEDRRQWKSSYLSSWA